MNGLIPEGYWPYAGLTLGPDNALYGVTNSGGVHGFGTVFRITNAGVLTVLHPFVDATDGQQPQAGLTLGPDGNFYGTTTYGPLAANGAGTIFKITPAGAFTTLFVFAVDAGCLCTPDGTNPIGEPVIDAAGNLYGIASGGGPAAGGSGTIWKLSPAGELTVLKAFTQATGVTGASPLAGLTFGRDGYLYGTTGGGGQNSIGTVFRLTPAGAYEVLHSFETIEGSIPDGRLLETSPGVFIGTTQIGGASNSGVVFRLTVPIVDVDVNGSDGPLTLHTGNPFQLTLAYQTNDAGVVNPARVYVGVVTPSGLLFLRSTGFSTVPGTFYSGPLPAIPPAILLNLPNAAAMPAGTYYWFMVVDTDGPGDAFDFVQVTVAP